MYRKYKGIRPSDSRRDTVQATLRDVREEARKVVNYSMYDFYELEPAEVDSVLLDESIDQFPKDENGDPTIPKLSLIKFKEEFNAFGQMRIVYSKLF